MELEDFETLKDRLRSIYKKVIEAKVPSASFLSLNELFFSQETFLKVAAFLEKIFREFESLGHISEEAKLEARCLDSKYISNLSNHIEEKPFTIFQKNRSYDKIKQRFQSYLVQIKAQHTRISLINFYTQKKSPSLEKVRTWNQMLISQ